jgi:hypothetical protein
LNEKGILMNDGTKSPLGDIEKMELEKEKNLLYHY